MTVEAENSSTFRRRKLIACLWIMGLGMLVALLWHSFQWLILAGQYPYTTFLFLPKARFSDFTDMLTTTLLPNPYLDPTIPYLPFTSAVLRPVALLPTDVSLIFFLFISLSGLALLLTSVLRPVMPGPWARVCAAYLLLGFSYPLVFCVDRGNIELFLILLIAATLFFMARAKYNLAMLWLLPAICFKLYPALLLVLLVRQRKFALAIATLIAFGLITLISLKILSLSPLTTWQFFHRNMDYYSDSYVYENHSLEGSASLWNCYKIGLISASALGLMAPTDFSYDGGFIHTSYAIYSVGMLLLVLVLVVFVGVVEKEFLRCAVLLLLFFAICAPAGGDYRLAYAGMALVLLVLAKTPRFQDWRVLILLALTMVPKKEIFLTYAGRTESFTRDVSIQSVLNPLLVLAAILLLVLDSWGHSDWPWSKLRLDQLKNTALGMLRTRPVPA